MTIKSERGFLAAAALLFAAMALAVYAPVLRGKVPLPGHFVTQFAAWSEFKSRDAWQPVANIGDVIDYFYPFNAFSSRQIREGTLPHWNPYLMAGMPFQAEPQSALFYPPHVLYYLFSTATAWSLALMLRMVLGALFMTMLMRALGAGRSGAVVAGVAFACGGFMVAWQGAVMGDAVAWLPLVCFAVHRLHANPSRRTVALAAFAFAMPVLAGHPETAVHVILTGAAAALLIWAFPPDSQSRFNPRFIFFFFSAGILAIGLSAVQLLPTLEWVAQSGRDPNAPWAGFLDRHQFLGFFSRDALRSTNSAGILVPNGLGYIGMLTLLAAALAPLHRPTRYVVWFVAVVVIGVMGTFGIEPIRSLLLHTPVIRGIKNERLVLLIDFGLAALAAFGITALQQEWPTQTRIRRALPWLFAGGGFAVAFFFVHKLQLATTFKVEVMRRPSFSRSLLLIALAIVVWRLVRRQRNTLFPIAAGALAIFDLATFAYGYTGFTWRDEMYPPAPVFEFLRQQGAPAGFRVAPLGMPFPMNTGIAYGLQFLSGFEAAVPTALQRFALDMTEGYPESVVLAPKKLLALQDRRLDMLNVKYIVAVATEAEHRMLTQHPDRFAEVFRRGRIVVFENKQALPRAFLVGATGAQVISGDAEQVEYIKQPTFDPLRSVVIDARPPGLAEGESSSAREFGGTVKTVEADVNGYRFQIEAAAPAILVVSQNYFKGWRATMDDRSLPVFPADHALTGIAVPAGNYELRFTFQPVTFRAGAVVSLVGVVVLIVLLTTDRGLLRQQRP